MDEKEIILVEDQKELSESYDNAPEIVEDEHVAWYNKPIVTVKNKKVTVKNIFKIVSIGAGVVAGAKWFANKRKEDVIECEYVEVEDCEVKSEDESLEEKNS